MVNKDFLRQVLRDDKKLFMATDLKKIYVPKYDELSVKNLWPKLQKNSEFMRYMPDKLPDGRLPDREYLFNVLNSVRPTYCQNLIEFANRQRNTANKHTKEAERIEVTEEWHAKLMASPFLSKVSSL